MVNVVKGVLVECDPAMKQFLLHLDEKHSLGGPFVIQGKTISSVLIDAMCFFHLSKVVGVKTCRKTVSYGATKTCHRHDIKGQKRVSAR